MALENVPKHLELDEVALQAYMISTIPDFRDAKDNLAVKKFAHGQSNPTYLLSLNGLKVVMRKKPPGKLLRGAHAVEREFTIQHALYR